MHGQRAVAKPDETPAETICETGCEYVVDAFDCSPFLLRDPEAMRCLCERIVADLELNVVGEPQWHQFPDPGGVTGLYLLSESHLACHTYPEIGFASFNLYCCRPRTDWPWSRVLSKTLEAGQVVVRRLPRGQVLSRTDSPTTLSEDDA